MTTTLPRVVLAVAMHSLGAHRSAWAQAMRAEFEMAEEDGRPLRFAFGCLLGAWRMLPRHSEGRFALISYALALGLLLPMAAVLAIGALHGFPFLEAGEGVSGFLSGSGTYRSLLNPGSQSVAPALTLAMLLLATFHVPLAWWVLDGDWERVATAMRFGAATMTTLVITTSCAALHVAPLLLPFAAIAIELAAVSAIAWAHAGRFEDETIEGFGTMS